MHRAINYLAELPPSIQGQNGSDALMRAARVVCSGFNLGAEVGYQIISTHFNPRCQPEWSEAEIRKKCGDAMVGNIKPHGHFLDKEPSNHANTPSYRPSEKEIKELFGFGEPTASNTVSSHNVSPLCPNNTALSPPASPRPEQVGQVPRRDGDESPIGVEEDDPHRLAHLYLYRFRHKDGYTIRYWCESWYRWENGAYDRMTDADMRGDLSRFVEREFSRLHEKRMNLYLDNREKGSDKEKPPSKRRVTRNLIGDVLQALAGECGISSSLSLPSWIGDGPRTSDLIAARNGIVHLPLLAAGESDHFLPATPRFFTLNRVGFDYEPDSPQPRAWLQFLADLWPDEPDSIDCLQEWFGYLLTPDTSLHKMLMIVGPPRAGKGTIGRILKSLLGEANVVAPTLGSLADRFGATPLIGKPVAIIADARLSGRADAIAVTEQLLSISGEDIRTVDRKNKEAITTKLNTRFVFFSNELPQFGDSSGAIVERFVMLRLVKTFAGQEDTGLSDRLHAELPGILLWAVEGWKRLQRTKRFTVSESASELVADAQALASPISQFIADRCEIDPAATTPKQELYDAWKRWCERHGRDKPGSQQLFSQKLRAAIPGLGTVRPRSEANRRPREYSGIRVLSDYESGEIPI